MRCWSCTADFKVALTDFLQLKIEPDAITAIFYFIFFIITVPNTERGVCPGMYIQTVSVKKAKVTLHLLCSQYAFNQ